MKWKLLSRVWLLATPWTIQSMEFSRPEYWSGQPFTSPGDLPNPGIKPRSPILQADSLPAETPGKPKNTGVGSLSLLQGIFPAQESNWGLLHCRWILYQLSYQGSPFLRVSLCICSVLYMLSSFFPIYHFISSEMLSTVVNYSMTSVPDISLLVTNCQNIIPDSQLPSAPPVSLLDSKTLNEVIKCAN